MTNRLAQHLDDIHRRLQCIHPEIDQHGSDEQRLLVDAMIQAVDRAIPNCTDRPPEDSAVALWRHEAIRPVSLCINSAELLLTDTEHPLSPTLTTEVECIYESAIKMNGLIRQIAAQIRTSSPPAHI